MDPAVDKCESGDAVDRDRYRFQARPGIGCRVVDLCLGKDPEGMVIIAFTAERVKASVYRDAVYPASRGGHRRAPLPGIRRRVVNLDDRGHLASNPAAKPAARNVQLSTDRPRREVVSLGRKIG